MLELKTDCRSGRKCIPSSTVVSVDSTFVIPLELTERVEFPYPFRVILELLRDKSNFNDALAVPVLMTYASAHPSKSDSIVLKKQKRKEIKVKVMKR